MTATTNNLKVVEVPGWDGETREVGVLKRVPDRAESGWISPTGNWWAVPECGHYAFASERCKASDPVHALEEKGWLHLSGGAIYTRRGHEVSTGQYDVLVALVPLFKGTLYARRFAESWAALMGYPLPE